MNARDRWPTHPKVPTLMWIAAMAKLGRVYFREEGYFTRNPYRDEWEVRLRVGEHHRMRIPFTVEEMTCMGNADLRRCLAAIVDSGST